MMIFIISGDLRASSAVCVSSTGGCQAPAALLLLAALKMFLSIRMHCSSQLPARGRSSFMLLALMLLHACVSSLHAERKKQ